MIKITTATEGGKEQTHKVPTSWRDFTWKQFVELNRKYPNRAEKLAAYTGIELNLLLNNIPFMAQVYDMCSFIFDGIGEDYANYMPKEARVRMAAVAKKAAEPGEEPPAYSIELDEWMRFERSRMALSMDPSRPFVGTIEMLKHYLGIEVSDRPCTEVIGMVVFYFNEINTFAVKYKALAESKPDPDEVSAGVSRFEKYGVYNTVAMFTGGDPRPEVIAEFEKAPLGIVYMELYRRKDQREFEKDLSQIKKLNAKAAN